MTIRTEPAVLLVDDDRLVRVTVAKGLRSKGYTVHEAECAEEAMTIAHAQTIDIALLDIQMKGIGGIEVADWLRETTGTPVVFLTAFGTEDLVHQATERGALGYLVKPLEVTQIVPAIETALARARQIQELSSTKMRLDTELAGAREVSVATGIVMEKLGLDRRSAFDRLRSHARSRRRKLKEVAGEVIQGSETTSLT